MRRFRRTGARRFIGKNGDTHNANSGAMAVAGILGYPKKDSLAKPHFFALHRGGAQLLRSCAVAKAAEFAFEYRNSSLVLGNGALSLWEGERPFEFKNPSEFSLGADSMTFGKIIYR